MNNNIKLIGVQFIKDYSPLMNNVEDNFLDIHILESQNIELRYVLGDDQLEEILEEYEAYAASGYTNINDYVSTDNQYIRNQYIKYILTYYTLYHSRFDLRDKLTNKGNLEQYSENSSNVFSMDRFEDYKNIAESYVTRMIKYLQDNLDSYPLYKAFVSDTCEYSNSGYSSSWYLGPEL